MWRGLILIGVMVMAALAGWWSADWKAAPERGAPVATLYLLDNGFHTDLAVPRHVLMAYDDALSEAVAQSGEGDWFLVGWGDSRFYREQGPVRDRIPDGLRALFTPGGSPAVVRLIPVRTQPDKPFPYEGVAFTLDQAGIEGVRQRLLQTLSSTASGDPIAADGLADDVPYEATFWASGERFSVAHVCNHWMAQVLYAGGISVPVGRALRSQSLTDAIERYNEGRTGLERPQ
ncbi:DUF2459 domain-containing protein [uncultured Brevundimonas sp.]|uniref:DUF2459 domain-containing protein n=1 Tax=uncultured Brevundimonas sp. TaxID=213418 RepID=UPI002627A3A0|nr:DUF2459 domain-containing protein [uncultured Brevundimonas sp.]